MDKELFKIEIKELNKKCNELKRKFIAENCPFKVNDNVIMFGVKGIVTFIEVTDDGKFEYMVRKLKKDGTPSLNVTRVQPWNIQHLQKLPE